MQNDFRKIECLVIDEFSVIGQKMFAWINRRCKEATGHNTLPFGGISIILVGDIAQLPPITDQVIYHKKSKSDLALEGYCVYCKFDTVVKFEVNERARGSSNDQHLFRQLQVRAMDGNSSADDWNLPLTRVPNNIPNIAAFEKQAVKLSFGNEKVPRDNYAKLRRLDKIVVQVNAKHSCS